ncbi:MAG: hypothetical protein Q8K96_02320 [Rubrivivax sp.]|nr:hypothetical protein [Rubrivivax sp.]
MTHGTYSVREFGSAADLAALLDTVTTHQAVCASLAHDGRVAGEIVTKAALPAHPGAKARGKAAFGLQASPGMLFVDHDAASAEGGMSRADLWQWLVRLIPGLKSAGVVWRPSGSSHIHHGDKDLTGLRGQHCFVLLQDASDGPRVMKILASRFWLEGLGRVEVSKSGALLQRCPIDTAPSDAARLIFAGGADCVPPLEQRRGPCVVLSEGGFLDSRREVLDLTADEHGRYEGLIEQAKAAALPLAMQRRAEHRGETVARRLPALIRQGLSAGEAEARISAAVDAAYGGMLLGDFELTIVHEEGKREVVTVAQVLADRDRYHEADCLDPLNPEHRSGSPDCRLYLHSASPIAYSLDDGGTVYRLRAAQQRMTVVRGARGELVSGLSELVAGLDNVFATDTGPVLIERGRRLALTVDRLMNLVGTSVVLTAAGAKGQLPMDLQRETAGLVLAALNT